MSNDKTPEHDEEKPRIKVTDRRKFTAAGELRDEPPAEPAAADEAAPADAQPQAASAATEPPQADDAGSAPAPEPESPEPDGLGATPPAADDTRAPVTDISDLPRDFNAFIEGMYIETMLYLGAIPDPRTGEVVEDLDMAKYKIDLLAMLEEKTRGNLSEDEAKQLEDVLYQLRMFFVQKGKGKAQD